MKKPLPRERVIELQRIYMEFFEPETGWPDYDTMDREFKEWLVKAGFVV